MITNDEAVELLDIAMNDLETYDAERDAISADMYDNCDPSDFRILELYEDNHLLTNSPSGFKFSQ
jgi:hypothetical protein